MLSTCLKLNTNIKNLGASSYLLAICSTYGQRLFQTMFLGDLIYLLVLKGALQCFVEVALKLSKHHRIPISSIASTLRVIESISAGWTFSPECYFYTLKRRKHFSDWNRSLNEGNRLAASSLF